MRIRRAYFDSADPGQWLFGVVSWPVTETDARQTMRERGIVATVETVHAREVVIGFAKWVLIFDV